MPSTVGPSMRAVIVLAIACGPIGCGGDPVASDGTEGGPPECTEGEAADDTAGEDFEDVVVPFFAAPDAFDTAYTFFGTTGHGGYTCDPGVSIDERTCPLDIHALRWDPDAGTYTRSRTQSNVPNPWPFSDDVMWGLALHSMVDGEVIACWRGMPDDDIDGDDVRCPGGEQQCTAGGNHIQILSDDGELWYFGHLQQDSIPLELCPIDEVYLYESDPKVCDLPAPWGGLRQSSRLDLRGVEPVRVNRGQMVGRVGTSGSGQGVHVHIHRKPFTYDDAGNPCEAPSPPLAFESMWVQDRVPDRAPSDDWTRVDGQTLPVDGSSMLLWPGDQPPTTACE